MSILAYGTAEAGPAAIPYTTVTSVHYQTLSKKTLLGRLVLTISLFVHYNAYLLLLFLDKSNDFANKNEEFCNPTTKRVIATINGMPHQLFVAGIQARCIYPEIKKCFYEKHSNVTWKSF